MAGRTRRPSGPPDLSGAEGALDILRVLVAGSFGARRLRHAGAPEILRELRRPSLQRRIPWAQNAVLPGTDDVFAAENQGNWQAKLVGPETVELGDYGRRTRPAEVWGTMDLAEFLAGQLAMEVVFAHEVVTIRASAEQLDPWTILPGRSLGLYFHAPVLLAGPGWFAFEQGEVWTPAAWRAACPPEFAFDR